MEEQLLLLLRNIETHLHNISVMTAEMLKMARKNEIVIEALMRDEDHDN